MDNLPVSKPKHTPLPWEVNTDTPPFFLKFRHATKHIGTARNDALSNDEAQANAEFIVRACNNHYKLLNALKELVYDIRDWNDALEILIGRQPRTLVDLDYAKTLIAEAEGKDND